jgi:hypothetical protein
LVRSSRRRLPSASLTASVNCFTLTTVPINLAIPPPPQKKNKNKKKSTFYSTQALTLIEKGFLKPLLRIASGCSVAIELAKEETSGSNSNSSTTTNVLLEIASSTLALQTILYATSSTEEISNLCVETLLDLNSIPRLVELILDLPSDVTKLSKSSKKIINTTLSILANLTRTERGSLELVGSTLPEEAVYKNRVEHLRPEDKEKAKNKNNELTQNNNTTNNNTNNTDNDEHTRIKPSMELLLDRFMKNNPYNAVRTDDTKESIDLTLLDIDEWDTALFESDPYQHFASLLMNATQVTGGRQFITRIPKVKNINNTGNSKDDKQPKSILEKLLPILREKTFYNSNSINSNSNSNSNSNGTSSNPFRRRGISGMIRNIAVDQKENSWWLLNICNVLTPLLLPLMGPEHLDISEKLNMDPDLWLYGPDQIRDLDSITRLYCVETILTLLATGRNSRKFITSNQTYIILKKCDAIEECELVSDRILECITLLRRDEDINIKEGGTPSSSVSVSGNGENTTDTNDEDGDDEDDTVDDIDIDTNKKIAGLLEGPSPSTQIKLNNVNYDDDTDFDEVD